MYAFNSAHVKCGVLIKYSTSVASSTWSVEDATEPAFNLFESLPIDLNVAFRLHRIALFNSAHVKCDV